MKETVTGKTAIGTYQIRTKDKCSQKNQMFWPVRANLDIFSDGKTIRRHSGTPNDVELVYNQVWPKDHDQVLAEWLQLGDALLQFRDNPNTDARLYQPANNWITTIMKKLPSELPFIRLCLDIRANHVGENQFEYLADLTIIGYGQTSDQKFTFKEFPELLTKLNKLFLLRSELVKSFLVSWARSEQKSISTPIPGVLDHKAEASISWIEPIWCKYPYERPTAGQLGDEVTEAYKNCPEPTDNDPEK